MFTAKEGYTDLPVEVPCGQCIGCRLERSRQWAVRCMLEASLHNENSFITLTYDEAHVPHDGGLRVEHWQQFMKRVRKKFTTKTIRFFHCGEYGSTNHRPHYHACLFGHDWPDKVKYSERSGVTLYYSPMLENLWQQGMCTTGDVTFDSAAYVARYICKKVTGERAEEHYQSVQPTTGEIFKIRPEYTTMSRRPGVAAQWFARYKDDVYPDDFLVLQGIKQRPPRFFDTILEKEDVKAYNRIKADRARAAAKQADNQTGERLMVREKVTKARVSTLSRDL